MEWKKNNEAEILGKKKLLYGIETGNRMVLRFKLLFRSGQSMSIPYALLPLIILEADKSLRIKAHGIEVLVKGRGLHRIEEWMNEQKLIWMKEANTAMDDQEMYEVFIQSIEVDGDLVL